MTGMVSNCCFFFVPYQTKCENCIIFLQVAYARWNRNQHSGTVHRDSVPALLAFVAKQLGCRGDLPKVGWD